MAIREFGSTTEEGTIIYNIVELLADNNSGDISAKDIRDNFIDIAESILPNVASGDFVTRPFTNDILLQQTNNDEGISGGKLIVQSGIEFDNQESKDLYGQSAAARTQTVPYPGPGNISHGDLTDLDAGNPHPQYLPFSGGVMLGDIGMGGFLDVPARWISSQGPYETSNTLGIYFENVNSATEILHIGSGTTVQFDADSSKMGTSVSLAHAYIRFDATQGDTSDITVNSSYNISQIRRRGVGKFEIYFSTNAILDHANYVVVAHSNGTSDNGSLEDMDLVNAASVVRSGEVFTLAIQDETNTYIDAKINDVVVYAVPSGVTAPDLAIVVE